MTIEIFKKPPKDFGNGIYAACIVRLNSQLLVLQRSARKADVGKWEFPGGKLEENETPSACISRELYEETGIKLNFFKKLEILYLRQLEMDFTLYLFAVSLSKVPEVNISEEHQDYRWVSIAGEEILLDTYL